MRKEKGAPEIERVLKRVAHVMQETVTEIDRAGRFNSNEFVVVLPERNKRQAIEIADEIRRRIEFAFGSSQDPSDQLTILASIAENPIDGVTVDDLFSKASGSLSKTIDSRSN